MSWGPSRSFPSTSFSDDSMDHAPDVMACRFGWVAGPSNSDPSLKAPLSNVESASSPPNVNPSNSADIFHSKRFSPCQGRLYHQLECGCRIRTDIVEDCGANCLEANMNLPPFFCNECVEKEAARILRERVVQHDARYPPRDTMAPEQIDQYYAEHTQLQNQYATDFAAYKADLKRRSRPSHPCMALEPSAAEMEFSTQIDSLSLALEAPTNVSKQISHITSRASRTLPGDPSDQLHWALNRLDLERGSCAVEYSSSQAPTNTNRLVSVDDDEEI